MQVGDVVVPSVASRRNGRSFHCGTGYYSHAIVGCLDPFVLVSSSGDMVWSKTWHKEEVTALCQASADIIQIVEARLERTGEHLPEYQNAFAGDDES